ncbi:uncharacterized protein PV09_08820 [Verruconis gallopava]|uniref:Uncharacterized protein n=1 Tax=Verruconis gallopava TaxID=253628 RepID=A0A0D1ZZT1_9PEZI|nr:uncharacterized protein PV09_08820 [Verruconis gallopava]KIV99514.1 hypothetical protein PV09_08820 [Verruconis gallopava]
MQPNTVHTSSVDVETLVSAIKTLFFRRLYKRCADQCVRNLTAYGHELHPAYKMFLLYFAGISNDCYARSMYSRSPLIPSALDEAEAFFTQARDLICEARVAQHHSFLPQPHDYLSDDSDDGSSSRSLHRSRHSEDITSRPSTAATSVSAYSTNTDILFYDWAEESEAKAVVSPLNVRKHHARPETSSKLPSTESTSFVWQSATSLDAATTSRPSPRLASFYLLRFPPSEPPSEPAPRIERVEHMLAEEDVPFPDEDECFHEPDHVEIYNSQLLTFSDMLTNHIASVRRFREQMKFTNSLTFVAAGRDGTGKRTMSIQERAERIMRGRERNWARPRFDSRRYQELCEVAEAEL